MSAIISYVRASIEELHQVRWPTRQQAVRLSVLVTGFSFGVAAVFGLVDFLLSNAVQLLISATA